MPLSVALFFLVPIAVLLKSGVAGALTWVCFALIPCLLAIDAVRTDVVATRGGRYHREREPRRYWGFLIFFGAPGHAVLAEWLHEQLASGSPDVP